MSQTQQRVTRKTARRGAPVTITEANGTVWTGTLTAFGERVVELAPDAESKARNFLDWKRNSFWPGNVTVEQ